MSIKEIYEIIKDVGDNPSMSNRVLNLVCKKKILDKCKANQSVVRCANEYHLPEVFFIKELGSIYVSTDAGRYSYSTFYYFTHGQYISDKDIDTFISDIKKEYRDQRIDDILS